MAKFQEDPTLSGVLLLDKPAGPTSHDMVGRVRRLYQTQRVGHTGTLDPLATGLLTVLVGRAAKAAEYLVSDDKCYTALLRLGITTDTEDVTGTILSRAEVIPSPETVAAACASMIGESEQIPPMYSALKVDGRKLVDIARAGGEVERKARPITIYSLTCTPTDSPTDYRLDVHCSKGTYIRTLCADIGAALGCGAVMADLRRTASGGFSLEKAYTLDAIEQMPPEERRNALIPLESLFASLPALQLGEFHEKLIRGGCAVAAKKLRTDLPLGTRLRLLGRDGFFALGEVIEADGTDAVKMIKLFSLS
ncbi:MAG: tRNA pseudouridine(55) synthase TruB [Clostridia bacterium]|nr:tRNA pseudouridine(55) synthase TruB [Clostridia bacterium]